MQNSTKTRQIHPVFAQWGRYIGRGPYNTYIPRRVRNRGLQPERLTISQWADRHRRVTEIDAVPGPWRNDLVPHAVQIMDTIGQPHVREVWICAVERAAKTQIMINTCLWTVDRSAQSGNIFWLMPTELDARQAMKNRIIPAISASPRTEKLLSKYADNTTASGVTFTNGLKLRPAWSNSPGSMASYFGRLNIADEVDKFPERTSEGTDPITLFRKRARDDRKSSKYVFASTPAGRYIYRGTMECEQVWSYRVRCPDCGELVDMDIDHLQIPEGTTYETAARAEISYACNECGALWAEYQREQAYVAGAWAAVKGADIAEPISVGFHFPALPCPKVSYAEIAAAYLKAQTGGHSDKCAWANGYLAIDYEEDQKTAVTEAALLRFRSDLPRNLVPPDTARLVLMADTQQDSFYYQVWALGYAPTISMQMIRHGQVMRFEDLEGLLLADWHDHEGRLYRMAGGLIDSGGTRRGYQKHSRTMEVYEWCSRHRTMLPIKGMHGRAGDLLSYKSVSTYPGVNKAIPGGLTRVNIRVDQFKDDLERTLALEPDDAGALQFHCDVDDSFAKHYTTETKDDKGDWTHNKSKGRNDYFDCTVYALAYREMIKLLPDMQRPAHRENKANSAAKPIKQERRRW